MRKIKYYLPIIITLLCLIADKAFSQSCPTCTGYTNSDNQKLCCAIKTSSTSVSGGTLDVRDNFNDSLNRGLDHINTYLDTYQPYLPLIYSQVRYANISNAEWTFSGLFRSGAGYAPYLSHTNNKLDSLQTTQNTALTKLTNINTAITGTMAMNMVNSPTVNLASTSKSFSVVALPSSSTALATSSLQTVGNNLILNLADNTANGGSLTGDYGGTPIGDLAAWNTAYTVPQVSLTSVTTVSASTGDAIGTAISSWISGNPTAVIIGSPVVWGIVNGTTEKHYALIRYRVPD